jgi:hypothetical protein
MATKLDGDFRTPANREGLLEAFAAELTLAAYRVALRTTTRGIWLDLELDLWRARADTVQTWGRELSQVPRAGDAACKVQRE